MKSPRGGRRGGRTSLHGALDVYPPRRVVKVGDTLVDVPDGLNAGVWSVAVIDSSNEMGLSE